MGEDYLKYTQRKKRTFELSKKKEFHNYVGYGNLCYSVLFDCIISVYF